MVVNRYSGYPFACHLKSTTTESVTSALKNIFFEWEFPQYIRTNGGPQFQSKFDTFCADNSIIHELSTPYNPQSNGLAEAGVKAVKFLLAKCRSLAQDFRQALQEWQNTPRANGFSPAQAFLGRCLRGCLPSLSLPTFDKVAYEEARSKNAKKLMDQHAAKPVLAELAVGNLVSIQDP